MIFRAWFLFSTALILAHRKNQAKRRLNKLFLYAGSTPFGRIEIPSYVVNSTQFGQGPSNFLIQWGKPRVETYT